MYVSVCLSVYMCVVTVFFTFKILDRVKYFHVYGPSARTNLWQQKFVLLPQGAALRAQAAAADAAAEAQPDAPEDNEHQVQGHVLRLHEPIAALRTAQNKGEALAVEGSRGGRGARGARGARETTPCQPLR